VFVWLLGGGELLAVVDAATTTAPFVLLLLSLLTTLMVLSLFVVVGLSQVFHSVSADIRANATHPVPLKQLVEFERCAPPAINLTSLCSHVCRPVSPLPVRVALRGGF